MNGLLAFIGFVSNATILAILVLMVLAGTVSAVLRIHDAGHDRRREEMGQAGGGGIWKRNPKGKGRDDAPMRSLGCLWYRVDRCWT